jgi:hypothetical protein
LSWLAALGIAMVSLVYFSDIFLKASHKCFWFDELFSVYLCRLPSFTSTWSAVMHGADFNAPLFYLLTRGAERLFGEGLIATRLPEMVGFWLFCICLFLFVSRHAGVVSGFIAAVFPFFTMAKYYAYEARAHGIILGWCGLALLCWQRNAEGRAKYLWLGGFGLSLVGALLTHIYAVYLLVPFAIVEIYNLVQRGRPNWGIIATMAFAFALVTLTVYLPLLHAYRTTIPASVSPASYGSLERFLINVIGPATIILFLFLLLSAANAMRRNQQAQPAEAMPRREMVLAAGFACIPLAGLIGCHLTHGPFFERYFLSSIAGYAMVAGFAASSHYCNSRVAGAMAGCMFLLVLADMGNTFYFTTSNRLVLSEPSSGLRLSTTPSNPMQMYQTLSGDHGGLDTLVLPSLEYLYFVRYAPPSVLSHLYYGAPANYFLRGGIERLAREARIDVKTTSFEPFLAAHNRFLLYESSSPSGGSAKIEAVQAIASAGFRLKSVAVDVGGMLYEYENCRNDRIEAALERSQGQR